MANNNFFDKLLHFLRSIDKNAHNTMMHSVCVQVGVLKMKFSSSELLQQQCRVKGAGGF